MTAAFTDVPLPAGADYGDEWQVDSSKSYRVVCGRIRPITDNDTAVWTSAIQFTDGTLDTAGTIEAPSITIDDYRTLNSDQARELAAALLEAAAEVDGWTAR